MDPSPVLARYPAVLVRGRVEPLGNPGGFSGARLWRVHTPAGPLCLRCGDPSDSAARLTWRHGLMRLARQAGLCFVPFVVETLDGATFVELAGRCWELQEWMAGTADFHADPTPARLHAGASALASLHRVWGGSPTSGVCPAVSRRLDAVRGWQPSSVTGGPLYAHAGRLVARWLGRVPDLLKDVPRTAIQPCLRDVWHDHLLFTGDRLTGIVDYAGMGPDSVAADLARMLGSLVGDDDARWSEALRAYRQVRPLPAEEEALARALDRAGAVVALANWLRRLAEPGAAPSEQENRRIEGLVSRLEGWG